MNMKQFNQYSKELTILYVEDDDSIREETLVIFNKIFKEITTAVDGEDGLEKFHQDEFDIVITDINMPKMDGKEMISHIREIDPEQKVVTISAHNESELLISLIKFGINSFILKPMGFQDMVASLYPVCRDAYAQKINLELIDELNDKNKVLEQQVRELQERANSITVKNMQIEHFIEKSEQESAEKDSGKKNTVLDDYFARDEDEGCENVVFHSDDAQDLIELFHEIPLIVSRYMDDRDSAYIDKIVALIARSSNIFMVYNPYLNELAESVNKLSSALSSNIENLNTILDTDPNMLLMIFDAIYVDIESYVTRFQVESLAMHNAHHIHKPTVLSIDQITVMLSTSDDDFDDDGDIEFF